MSGPILVLKLWQVLYVKDKRAGNREKINSNFYEYLATGSVANVQLSNSGTYKLKGRTTKVFEFWEKLG